MNGNNLSVQFRPPPYTSTPARSIPGFRRGDGLAGQATGQATGQAQSIDEMVHAFTEHCKDGGRDFLGHVREWHMVDALEAINDAANGGYTPIEAMRKIHEALGELIAIAVINHREALEWEGVE